eukprot:GHVQ01022244.1.p1 GENE.GHVQ01022244.1~~GHVQ01022244.1.p1  ORF type:complete len:174 (-),score=40.54 GHVQ01022244.1:816-1337(-)
MLAATPHVDIFNSLLRLRSTPSTRLSPLLLHSSLPSPHPRLTQTPPSASPLPPPPPRGHLLFVNICGTCCSTATGSQALCWKRGGGTLRFVQSVRDNSNLADTVDGKHMNKEDLTALIEADHQQLMNDPRSGVTDAQMKECLLNWDWSRNVGLANPDGFWSLLKAQSCRGGSL